MIFRPNIVKKKLLLMQNDYNYQIESQNYEWRKFMIIKRNAYQNVMCGAEYLHLMYQLNLSHLHTQTRLNLT